MALSKSSRIIILLVIDSCFFLLELVSGYSVHSLALVADSFHMLNDVLSLCVGLWAVKMANKSSAPKMYTYGYQRAETLGALVNGVFLVALCVTIFLDAIQRFVEPQEVSNPQLVLIVGCLGLASNLVGLVLFHDVGHSHGGGGHGHDHGDDNAVKDAEEGHAHDHSGHSHSHAAPASTEEHTHNGVGRTSSESTAVKRRHSRSHSKSYVNYEDFPGPAGFRNSIIAHGRLEALESEEGTDGEASPAENGNATTEADPLLIASHAGYGSVPRKSIDHAEHNHSKPRESGSGGGHGHSHGDLNMKGIFLHVMGDALGNIGVIATALIIWLTKFPGRFYFDPAISLVITIIILCSAIPLCKAASRILLQAVPHGIEVDDIRDDIQDLPGIESCHHLHVWQLSDTKLVASLHVRVNFNFRAEGSQRYMQLASAIRQCLHEYGIHSSTIQPEFHRGSEYEGDDGHRNAPAPGEGGDEQDCLLDCGDGCGDGGKSCCPPAQRNGSEASSGAGHEGHRH
ncbi:unnamed protein product [Zymoseptoria tritici ST99CH_3D1]|uniref:Zinc/cadmium transporter n=3 Tax=Zymoseptoria tritici TaxID=1047171 RepID=F9XBI8_ZYMTI|nr:putative zinc/cadmium transporter [Zymoseptoria tritici IPO323]EGP87374.1 putative zinc/cadmium transporter [Zymoseptoria tritici IPO323]SMQ51337.1 unnamed protein product [Zymoseptoria tritici ST99CH_3D7]SMR53247.1 unnamed protein product [Zymoseptoria tritici ST99CH_1E4]SMR54914.1 unnamed protein product [Zymoseptoria tritici ST99CH_3D1]